MLIAMAGAGHAQQTAASSSPTGRLGQRYVGTSFGIANFKDASEEMYDASIGINLPVSKSVDVDFGYGYQWLTNNPVDVSAQVVDAGATLFTSTHGVKPFLGASLAYGWSKASYAGSSITDDEGLYGLSIGLEAPVGAVILTPAIGYSDSFNDGDPTYTYGIDAHYWVTSKMGVRTAVSYSDHGSNLESWNCRVGLRMRF
jgi:hypothetical protein